MGPSDPGGPLPVLPGPEVRAKLRRAMGITVQAACAELGVSRQSYSYWERDIRVPRPRHLRAYRAQLSRWEEAAGEKG